ncbi:glycine-rich domain-containing protein [Corynebacterium sp. MNWGS58]|uniref:glycine-rich domain-containing protein n=1 Tax=Corynebacterium sp. 102791.4 TaxID=3104612 RepID=UPI00351286E9
MWTQTTTKEYDRAGSYTYQPPDWCNFLSIIAVGGGGGGEGSYLIYNPSKGGGAGKVRHMHFTRANKSPISVNVGSGGRPGRGQGTNNEASMNGQPTSVQVNGATHSVDGGRIGKAAGIVGENASGSPSTASQSVLNHHQGVLAYSEARGGLRPRPGIPGNRGNRGSGGSGSNHASFVGATIGGAGGDGYVAIVCFGVDPTLPRLTEG